MILLLAQGVIAGSIVDTDGDGVPDDLDNCRLVQNGPLANPGSCPSQFDVDQDGYGNACDTDISNNTVVGLEDGGAILASFGANDPLADVTCNGVVGLEDLGEWISAIGSSPAGDSGLACAGTVPSTN